MNTQKLVSDGIVALMKSLPCANGYQGWWTTCTKVPRRNEKYIQTVVYTHSKKGGIKKGGVYVCS